MKEDMRNNCRDIATRYGWQVVDVEALVTEWKQAGWKSRDHMHGVRMWALGQPAGALGNKPTPSTQARREAYVAASARAFDEAYTTVERVAVQKGWLQAHEVREASNDRRG
jgi:hypothetical protein